MAPIKVTIQDILVGNYNPNTWYIDLLILDDQDLPRGNYFLGNDGQESILVFARMRRLHPGRVHRLWRPAIVDGVLTWSGPNIEVDRPEVPGHNVFLF